MNRKLKKVLALGLGAVLLTCSMGFTQKMNADELNLQREIAAQQEALAAYRQLWDHFVEDEETMKPTYPENYGGEYIEEDKLVLLLTQNTPENQAQYREWCGGSDRVVFQEAAYSLNYLEGLRTQAELLATANLTNDSRI